MSNNRRNRNPPPPPPIPPPPPPIPPPPPPIVVNGAHNNLFVINSFQILLQGQQAKKRVRSAFAGDRKSFNELAQIFQSDYARVKDKINLKIVECEESDNYDLLPFSILQDCNIRTILYRRYPFDFNGNSGSNLKLQVDVAKSFVQISEHGGSVPTELVWDRDLHAKREKMKMSRASPSEKDKISHILGMGLNFQNGRLVVDHTKSPLFPFEANGHFVFVGLTPNEFEFVGLEVQPNAGKKHVVGLAMKAICFWLEKMTLCGSADGLSMSEVQKLLKDDGISYQQFFNAVDHRMFSLAVSYLLSYVNVDDSQVYLARKALLDKAPFRSFGKNFRACKFVVPARLPTAELDLEPDTVPEEVMEEVEIEENSNF
jgi:hypothetical protein